MLFRKTNMNYFVKCIEKRAQLNFWRRAVVIVRGDRGRLRPSSLLSLILASLLVKIVLIIIMTYR